MGPASFRWPNPGCLYGYHFWASQQWHSDPRVREGEEAYSTVFVKRSTQRGRCSRAGVKGLEGHSDRVLILIGVVGARVIRLFCWARPYPPQRIHCVRGSSLYENSSHPGQSASEE